MIEDFELKYIMNMLKIIKQSIQLDPFYAVDLQTNINRIDLLLEMFDKETANG